MHIYTGLGVGEHKKITVLKLLRYNLRIFERQILRKISGPVNIDNIWRIRNNTEIDKLIEGADIVRFINL